ncbi:MAG: hypothetical protein ABJM29_07585 [Rhizobiaceae bacterium]
MSKTLQGTVPVGPGADAVAEDTGRCATALELHDKLIAIFGHQLDRFESGGGGRGGDDNDDGAADGVVDVEQAAKALAILAKTLESIAAVSIKLGNGLGKSNPQQSGNSNDPHSRSSTTEREELDRQLTKLVGDLVQTGEV